MSFLIKDKKFYRRLAAIAVPIALQNLINFGVSMADTVMLGMLGEVQLSAAAIANQLGFIYMLLAFGTGSGASVLIAQFWGKGDTDSIRRVITIMYRIMAVSAAVFTLAAMGFPHQVMMVFTTDADVIAEGARFLRIVGASYFFAGLTSVTVVMLRSVQSVKISIVVYICSLITNVFLNWVLIFGKLGAPALGVVGAAIATCIARMVEFAIAAAYMRLFEKKICYRFQLILAQKSGMLRNFIENALPVLFNELLWGGGTAVIAVVIGRMGREFTAANAICQVLSQLVTIVLFGVASASAVLVGNTVGQGRYDRVKSYAETIVFLSFCLGLVSCGVVLLLKGPMLQLYNVSELAKTYANQIMIIYAIDVVFVSVSCTALIGILRGGGDTRFVLVMDVAFMWLVCIPLGFLTGPYLHWPVWAVYAILKCDEVLKAVFSLIRIAKGKWINDVTLQKNSVEI